MKILRFSAIALLMVLGASCYSTDKIALPAKKKVAILPGEEGKFLKVIYESNRPGKVRISLFADHWLLYHKRYIGSRFIQPFDLTDLPGGQYQLEIQTPGGKVEKVIEVTDTKVYEVTR